MDAEICAYASGGYYYECFLCTRFGGNHLHGGWGSEKPLEWLVTHMKAEHRLEHFTIGFETYARAEDRRIFNEMMVVS